MLTVIFCIFIMCFFMIVGDILLSFVEKENDSIYMIAPIIGMAFVTVVTVNFLAFMPIENFKYIFIFIIIFALAFRVKKIIHILKKQVTNVPFIIFVIISSIILCLPIIDQMQLVSITKTNNDLIYYLADMEWLSGHTYFEMPTFEALKPYYYVTQNMYIHYSRLGFDAVGSLIMNLTSLEAYQVFFPYCICSAISLNILFLYFSHKVFDLSSKRNTWFAILLTISLNIWNLIGFQYGPQIFGIMCMAGTIFGLINFWKNISPRWFLFSALMLSANIAVYSEFAYYLFIIFVITTFIGCIYYRKKVTIAKNLLYIVGIGMCGLFMCIPATYKAIRYYLYLLDATNSGVDSLNADGWIVVRGREILTDLLGLSFSPNTDVGISFGIIGFIVAYIIWGIIFIFMVIKIKENKEFEFVTLSFIMCFFSILEIIFALIGFDYGEYKHLISVQPFVYLMLIITLRELEKRVKRNGTFICQAILLFIVLGNLVQMQNCFSMDSYNVYDSDLKELRDLSKEIDENIQIFIPEEYACDEQHQIIYALKDCNLIIPGNSYFYKYSNHNYLRANAIIIDKDLDDIEEKYTRGRILYNTNRFVIYSFDYEKEYFTDGKMNIDLLDKEFEIAEDCLKTKDGIYCLSNEGGNKIWGPYLPLLRGTYKFDSSFSVINEKDTDIIVGNFQVYDLVKDKILFQTNINANENKFENVEFKLDYDCEKIEFRYYIKENVEIYIENLDIHKREDKI